MRASKEEIAKRGIGDLQFNCTLCAVGEVQKARKCCLLACPFQHFLENSGGCGK